MSKYVLEQSVLVQEIFTALQYAHPFGLCNMRKTLLSEQQASSLQMSFQYCRSSDKAISHHMKLL